VVCCRPCGLGDLTPRPDQASLGCLYPDEYTWYHPPTRRQSLWARGKQGLRRLVMARYFGTPPPLRGWGGHALAWLASWWLYPRSQSLTGLPYQGQGRLLDYGCGSGWYAEQMRELGWQVTGMDFSAYAAEQVQRHFGIPTLTGTLPHAQVPPGSFDVITMGAVLEHVHDPHRLIAAAVEALAPGGYLVLSVPNLASWGFRYFQEHWWGLQLPHHLLHFTPDTLRRLLTAQGLEVRLRTVGRPGWMQRSLKAARAGQAYFRRRLLVKLGRLRLLSSLLARWTAWTGETDCIEAIASRPSVPAPAQAA
jgi:SAM-dependent methyltransferase